MFLWTDLVELVRHPFSALGVIDARRHLADGLLALGLSVTLPAVVAELIAISTVLWVAAGGLIHLIARALGGRGSFAGLMKLVGYAALVGLVALPVGLADALLKLQGNARAELSVGQLAGLLGVAIFLWQNALLVIATRRHYAISTERAVAAVIGPIGAVLVLALALIILAITLAIISQQPA
jgi:hypothetical protein